MIVDFVIFFTGESDLLLYLKEVISYIVCIFFKVTLFSKLYKKLQLNCIEKGL